MTKYVVMDIESTGLNRFKDKITFIGVLLPQDKRYFIFTMKQRKKFIRLMNLLLDKGYKFVWQNGKFDTLFIDHHCGIELPIDEDTMVLGTAFDMAAPHGLKIMAQNYLGVDDWDIGKDKSSDDPAVVTPYLKKDLKYTWLVFRFLMRNIRVPEMKIYRKLLLPAYKMYYDIERRGIYLNVNDTHGLRKLYLKERKKLSNELAELSGSKTINWNSPKQVTALLFDRLGLPIIKYTKTGNPSADAETLKRLEKRTQHPVVIALIKYKEYNGAITKFLTRWPKDAQDSRIHPQFKLTNVVTGRTSCSDPNLQQVPRKKELRSLFTAKEGYTLLNADYSQIELRVAAHYSQDPVMLRIYRTGGDIHTKTAQTLSGAVKPTKEQRTAAKAVNFGFLYGMGARKFVSQAFNSYGVDVSEAQAQDFRNAYFNQFPRLLMWHQKQEDLCEQDGGVFNLFGRYRRLEDIHSQDGYERGSAIRCAINTPVQSTASDILLSAALEIHACLKQEFPSSAIVGTIHDSIMVEARDSDKEAIAARIKEIMAHPKLLDVFGVTLSVPLVADITEGAWGLND